MPEMNGFELLHKIKEKDPQKPCIIMSGTGRYKKTAQDLCADGFLAKPFAMADLFKVVETSIDPNDTCNPLTNNLKLEHCF